jgi:signal transduction histidine kinase
VLKAELSNPQDYKQKVFLTLVYWSLFLDGIGVSLTLVSMVFFKNGLSVYILLSHAFITVLLVLYSIWLVRHNHNKRARTVYLGSEMVLMATLMLTMPESVVPSVMLALGSFVILAPFLMPISHSFRWAAFAILIATVSLYMRSQSSEYIVYMGWIEPIMTYTMTPLVIVLYVLLGSLPGQAAALALSESEQARKQVLSINTSLEETIAIRTAELRQALETAQDARQQAERMRYFIQGLGHDLKTPAASIEMCVNELMYVLPPAETDAWREVHRIDETREVLSRRIWTMLDIATGMENGLTITPTSFQELEEEATLNMSSIKRAYNAEHVHISFAYQLGTILVDGAALGRVIENLVVNSIKAQREQARGWVRVEIVQSPNVVTITVDDNGPGFPQLRLKSIETVTTLQKRPKGSHGLGLVGVRTIVEMLGGSLTLANRAEGGAKVSITLPQPDTQPILEEQTHATSISC